jgi:hypothetical protein
VARRNECTNPALGADATGWAPSNATGGRVTVAGFDRPDAYRVTCSVDGGYHARGPRWDLAAGDVVTASGYVIGSSPGNTDLQIQWFSATGYLSATSGATRSEGTETAGTLHRFVLLGTAPADTAYAHVILVDYAGIAGETLDVTMFLYERGDTGALAYGDGETTGWQWDGVRYSSTSSEVASVTGALVGTLPALSAALTGSATVTGQVAASLLAATAALAGETRAAGTLAGSLPAPTADLAGDLSARGTLDGQLPALGASLAATATLRGQLAGSLPALRASLTAAPQAAWPPAAGAPTLAAPVTAGAPTVTRGAGAGKPTVHQAVSAGGPTVSGR